MGFLKNAIEAGQKGITKLLRFDHDTIDIFEEAKNFDPESGYKTLDVDANGFGILYRDSPERFLHTYNVNVCTGIALSCPKEDFYAMVHLYSNRSHYNVKNAQAAIENHAREAWRRFEAFLPPHMIFNAVSFGGKKQFKDVPPGLPDSHLVFKYYTGPDQKVSDSEINEKTIVLGQMAVAASVWLADAFYEAAADSGRIDELEDARYSRHAHHVLIDKKTGQIYFGRDGDGLNQKILAHTEKRAGSYIFPHLGITANTKAVTDPSPSS